MVYYNMYLQYQSTTKTISKTPNCNQNNPGLKSSHKHFENKFPLYKSQKFGDKEHDILQNEFKVKNEYREDYIFH